MQPLGRLPVWLVGVMGVGLLLGCDAGSDSVASAQSSVATTEATVAPVSPVATAEATPPPQPKLPVSLNSLMVALVNHAADPIWLAAWRNPTSDGDWRELERLAVQLQVGGALLTVPGTGPLDEAWVAEPGWAAWADELREAGAQAVIAAKARDVEAIRSVGDEIIEICEGCHIDFKPALPTGGQFGELSPTAGDFEEDQPPP